MNTTPPDPAGVDAPDGTAAAPAAAPPAGTAAGTPADAPADAPADTAASADGDAPYLTLDALRQAHAGLLKRHRDLGRPADNVFEPGRDPAAGRPDYGQF